MARTHRRINVAAQVAVSLFREADEWAAKGDLGNEQKALDAARAQLELVGIGSREEAQEMASERVPFTAKEETQADLDAAAAADAQAAAAAALVAQKALTTKLSAGTATDLEVQKALARLLGGG